jgi:hypothetical protein
MARTPQTNTDKVIARLTTEQKDYLRSLCDQHANGTDIHRYLIKFAPDLSYDSVMTWYNREYDAGADAKAVNSLVSASRGINCIDAHAASLAAVIRLVDSIQSAIAETGLREVSASLLSNLVDLLREQRQSAQSLHTLRRLEDRRDLILSGGYRLAEIALTMSRDTGNHEAVKGILEGAIAKLESEV